MNDKELSQCEKRATSYRYSRNCFFIICIVLVALCGYTIIQWQQEKVARVESEQTAVHYQQQWVDALFERNVYYQLYENCQNQNKPIE